MLTLSCARFAFMYSCVDIDQWFPFYRCTPYPSESRFKVIEFVGEVYKQSLVWDRLPVRACPWKSHNLLIHWDLCEYPSVRRIWVTWDSFKQKFFLLLSWVCSIFLPMCINFKHAAYPCACLDSQLHVGWQTHVKHMEYCLSCFGLYHCC